MEIFCTFGQATDENIIWRMRFACWITKATDTHSEHVIPFALLRKVCLAKDPHYYVILHWSH